ncbi:IS21 family transposase [Deinococcus saxicola]
MTKKRVTMRKIREVLRLKFDLNHSDRDIGRSVGMARSTVQDYLKRAHAAGLTWPLSPELSDPQLETLLFRQREQPKSDRRLQPNWDTIDRELRRKGVTRFLLWEEYRRQYPNGMQYATFTTHYRRWKVTAGLSMRQIHTAGEKLFVDYAGLTLSITDPSTGVIHPGQVFVATLGASDYTYVEVTRTQRSEDWLSSHVRAFASFGGVPEIVVPDNLKAGVTHASRYEPELNRAYAELAEHYGVAIIPARVRRPRDKALVEVHVQIVERRLLAPLRDRIFFSVTEANEALSGPLLALNTQAFQKRPGSRWALFTELDQPALHPLPVQPFEVATWKRTTVGLDYHVELDGHHYSVPYQHAKTSVDLRVTPLLLEVFRDSMRIAVHHRVLDTSSTHQRQTTVKEHMPMRHQQYGETTSQHLLHRAEALGNDTTRMVEGLLAAGRHPQQGVRACLGLFKLAQAYGAERLEAACCRAVTLQSFSYRSVESILKHHLDVVPMTPEDPTPRVADHVNVRGPAYYGQEQVEHSSTSTEHDFAPTLN